MRPKIFLPVVAALLLPATLRAQSLLDRSPNVSGNWTGAAGTLHFNFVHRFTASDGPERKVSNVPTFLVAAGLPKRLLAGFNYSSNSTLAPRFPNEWELFARWAPLSQDYGAPVDLAAQVGYNNAADGGDAEVSLARKLGIARVILAGRALSDPLEAGSVRYAMAGGGTIRFGQYIAIAGDVSSLTDRDSTERVAWSAGFHFAIPLTPHTVSIHATNAMLTTLQGASRGSSTVRYGFEFTIPLTLRRYFGKRSEQAPETDSATVAAVPAQAPPIAAPVESVAVAPAPVTTRPAEVVPPPVATPVQPAPAPTRAPAPARTETPARAPAAPPAARVVRTAMKNTAYLRQRLQITVGTTVEWTNNDPMPHSVTAVDRSFNSGLINPGKTYRHTFTKAGTYNIFCMPHPFMKGVVVVREQ